MAVGCRRLVCETRCAVDGATDAPARSTGEAWARLVLVALAVLVGWLLVTLVSIGGGRRGAGRGVRAVTVVSRMTLRSLGIRLAVVGKPRSGPGLVVGNHVSWLDVLVLSACTPMRQVAKSEVADWPVVGSFSRRSGALFIRRGYWRQLPDLVEAMTTALRQGDKVQVFPEATTRCGGAVAEFRRAGFQAAIDAAVVVLPVTLTYRDGEGRQTAQPAFVGDENLMSAVRRTVGLSGLSVDVHWLRPIPAIAGTGQWARDRAGVTTLVESAVARHLQVPVVRGQRRTAAAAPLSVPVSLPGTMAG